MAERDPVLVVEDLVCEFGSRRRGAPRVRAVDGVNLELARGETLAVVGESGCGKTTLARAVLRLVEPARGRVVVDGQDITGARGAELRQIRRRVQIVFQDPYASLNPRMTVGDAVSQPLRAHGMWSRTNGRDQVRDLLAKVGLDDSYAERLPRELSGGQRQRVGIARALALQPAILVLDEPVSSLDTSIRAQVLELLKDLQDETAMAYLFISHDLGVVRQVAHRVGVMYLGRLVETGSADDVFNAPAHPYTRALLSAVPVPDPRRRRLAQRILLTGELPDPANPPSGCVFRTRCPEVTDRCSREDPGRCPCTTSASASDGTEPPVHRCACVLVDQTQAYPPGD